MSTMLNIITAKVYDAVGDGEVDFDTPVTVKPTPHTLPVYIHAICVSPLQKLYVRTDENSWHVVEPNRESARLIQSLYQRVMSMELFKGKEVA